MKDKIRHWLSAPVFDGDEEKSWRAKLINLAIIACVLLDSLILIGDLLGGRIPAAAYIIGLVYLGTLFIARSLLFRGKVALAGVLVITLGITTVALVLAQLGTVRAPIATALVVFISLAGLLYGRWGALLSTVASSLIILSLILAENAGLLPKPDYVVNISQWITYTAVFATTGSVVLLSYRTTRHALEQAFSEMAERKQVEKALRESEERYRTLVETADDAIILTDLQGRHLFRNSTFYTSLGFQVGDSIELNGFSRVHPDDLSLVRAGLDELTQKGESSGEYRVRHKDGHWIYRYNKARVVRDAEGQPKALLSIIRDITERKQAEEALRESEEKFRKLFEHVGDYAIVLERRNMTELIIMDVNDAACSLHGYTRDELIGHPISLLDTMVNESAMGERVPQLMSNQTIHFETLHRRKDGSIFPVEVSARMVLLDGKPPLIFSTERDITERKRVQAELERLATTDSLTGVYNRHQLVSLAEIEFERARRYKHPTSTIMLDIDYFKQINDTYGHATGDKVLLSLAQLLTREVRTSDLVARYGGEEFMLLLPETSLEKAQEMAERIRFTVADTPFMVDGQTIRFTISLGVTSSESVGQDFESLLKEADRLMYQAKQSGRNRIATRS